MKKYYFMTLALMALCLNVAVMNVQADTLYVRIEDNTKARLYMPSGWSSVQVALENDVWNLVEYESKNLPMQVKPVGSAVIYQVMLNNTPVPLTEGYLNSYYAINPTANKDSLDIRTNAPSDLTVLLTMKFQSSGMESAIDSITIDGEKVAYNSSINVPWGKNVKIWFDTEHYKVTVNGTTINTYYSKVLTEATTLDIYAEKYVDWNVTLIANHSNCFTAKDYNNQTISLNEGTNTVSVSSKNPKIYLSKNNGCLIDSVLVDDAKVSSFSSITCVDGMKIEVFADSIQRDQTCMLYIDDATLYNATYFDCYTTDREDLLTEYTTGYSTVRFATLDNYITIGAKLNDGGIPVFYQNDTILPKTSYFNSFIRTIEINNGDVIKIMSDTALIDTVRIIKGEEMIIRRLTKDRIIELEPNTAEFQVLRNAEVAIAVDNNLEVTVNGEPMLMNAEGEYVITINGNTTIEVVEKAEEVIPSTADTVDIVATNLDVYDQTAKETKGYVAFTASNDTYSVTLSIFSSTLTGTWATESFDVYSYIIKDNSLDGYSRVTEGKVTYEEFENGNKRLTGWIICANDVRYNLDLSYEKPEATRQDTIVITDAKMKDDREQYGQIVFKGYNEEHTRMMYVTVETDMIEGTFNEQSISKWYTYMVIINEEGEAEDYYDYISGSVTISESEDGTTYHLRGSMVMQGEKNRDDAPEIYVEMTASKQKGMDYDSEDKAFDETMNNITKLEAYSQEGLLYALLQATNTRNDTTYNVSLMFIIEQVDEQIVIPEGTYYVDSNYGTNTVVACEGVSSAGVFPSLAYATDNKGQILTMWFIRDGEFTVTKNAQGKLHVEANAINSAEQPIHIVINDENGTEDLMPASQPKDNAVKYIENGLLIIERLGIKYSILGNAL